MIPTPGMRAGTTISIPWCANIPSIRVAKKRKPCTSRWTPERRCIKRVRREKSESISLARRFYQKGLRQLEAGDAEEARKTWQNVATAFAPITEDKPWIALAREGAKALSPDGTAAAAKKLELEKALEEIGVSDKPETG